MSSLLKLWPFVVPHRRRLGWAVVAASIGAVLWSLALLLAFPITKVLLQQQSLDEFFASEIVAAQLQVERHSQRLAVLDAQIAAAEECGATDTSEHLRSLQSRARCQAELGTAGRSEWWYTEVRDRLTPFLPQDRFETLALLFCGLMIVTGLHCIAGYLQEVQIGTVVQLSMRSLQTQLFRRTLALDVQTLGIEGTPALMSRFTNDLTSISDGLRLLGGRIILEPLKVIACLVAAFGLNWRLTLLSLVVAPLGAWVFQDFGRKLKKASRRQMEVVARVYGVMQETLGSFRVVTAFAHPQRHRLQLHRESRDYFRRAMQIARIDALVHPTIEMLGVMAACVAILPGAYLVIQGKTTIWGVQLTAAPMDLSELAVLYTLLAGVLDPARKLSGAFSKLKRSVAAVERVFDWNERISLLPANELPQIDLPPAAAIELDRVTFCYHSAVPTEERPPALRDVSLKIPAGEVMAIVGGNGSGKSTLVGLLLRFFDPQQGSVRWGGVDLRQLPIRQLREVIGWVPQEPMLFDRTIAQNIAMGRTDATRAEIEDVARRAHVWDFAAGWPEGLETAVGEKGQRLSGGQRQRIALARAMLRNPQLLILDEATSAIDAHSEQAVYESLQCFRSGRTVVVITHAMTAELLAVTDRIVVLDRGSVVAIGTHDELLETCPPYAALYQAQTARRAA